MNFNSSYDLENIFVATFVICYSTYNISIVIVIESYIKHVCNCSVKMFMLFDI